MVITAKSTRCYPPEPLGSEASQRYLHLAALAELQEFRRDAALERLGVSHLDDEAILDHRRVDRTSRLEDVDTGLGQGASNAGTVSDPGQITCQAPTLAIAKTPDAGGPPIIAGQTATFRYVDRPELVETFADSITGMFGIFRQDFSIGGLSLQGILNALETKGLSRTLAKPTLVAMSGERASFLAGGEFPVPVPGALPGSITSISTEM